MKIAVKFLNFKNLILFIIFIISKISSASPEHKEELDDLVKGIHIHDIIANADSCDIYKFDTLSINKNISYKITDGLVVWNDGARQILTQLTDSAIRRVRNSVNPVNPNYILRCWKNNINIDVFISENTGNARIVYKKEIIATLGEIKDAEYFNLWNSYLFNYGSEVLVETPKEIIKKENLRISEPQIYEIILIEKSIHDKVLEVELCSCEQENIQRVRGMITQPEVVKLVHIKYADLKEVVLHNPGIPIIEAIIDKNGNICNPRIMKPLRYKILEKIAIETIRKWQFKPATLNGQPICVYFKLAMIIHYK